MSDPQHISGAIREVLQEMRALRDTVEQQGRALRRVEKQLGSQLLSRSEAAKRLDVSEKTVIRREQAGKLTRLEVGGCVRYLVSEVDELKQVA